MDANAVEFKTAPNPPRKMRLWPAILLATLATGSVVWVRLQESWPFQSRNLVTGQIVIISLILLMIWWTFFSRAPGRLRLRTTYGLIAFALVFALLFRLRGMSGDMAPIFEFRWSRPNAVEQLPPPSAPSITLHSDGLATSDFPQFLGPNRNGVLSGPRLATNWTAQPPAVIWRQNVGAGWSGFAVVGNVCLTHEQRGENECVTAYELTSGRPLWTHSDKARYNTVVAGEGPRDTPTVVSNRVYTCGATGLLNCLDLSTGRRIWLRDLLAGDGKIPDWGVASSPLLVDGMIVVHGGEKARHSLYAFRADDGQPIWTAGTINPSYASPTLATLAGTRQVLAFNDGSVSGHDVKTGATLWEKSWGNGHVVCAAPVVINENQVLFSSGYGVGCELLEISRATNSKFTVKTLWKSIRMKAKFAHIFARDGFLYGLDDGIFACVDLKDGSQRWKEGRYGHGQGLLVGDLYVLMAESGDLVLLHPTPASANELARFSVFKAKTWNPIALAGNLLLVRNDQEAACLRLPLATARLAQSRSP